MNARRMPRGTPLSAEQAAQLRAVVESAGSVDAAARRLDIPNKTLRSALAGKNLYPATLVAFASSLARSGAQ